MSDDAQPAAAEVRAAVDAVKAALDRHLEAIENRTGEDDPAVFAAFEALASAAENYDELLYDAYDEVTPLEVFHGDDDDDDDEDDDEDEDDEGDGEYDELDDPDDDEDEYTGLDVEDYDDESDTAKR